MRSRAEVASVVRVLLSRRPGARHEIHDFFLLNRSSAVLLRLSSPRYPLDELVRLVDAQNVSVTGSAAPTRARDFDRAHPGLLPWVERRPVVTDCGFALALVVGVLALAILVGWLRG